MEPTFACHYDCSRFPSWSKISELTFTQAISSGFRRYFDFRTRSSRSEYWWWTLFAILVSVAATILDAILFGGAPISDTISSLALLIPGLAVAIRRLHDVDRSGWWFLIAFTLIGILFPLLYWYLQSGTKGTNKYGPDPLLSPANGSPEYAGGPMVFGDSQKFCSNCGTLLDSSANFCRSCGTAV